MLNHALRHLFFLSLFLAGTFFFFFKQHSKSSPTFSLLLFISTLCYFFPKKKKHKNSKGMEKHSFVFLPCQKRLVRLLPRLLLDCTIAPQIINNQYSTYFIQIKDNEDQKKTVLLSDSVMDCSK